MNKPPADRFSASPAQKLLSLQTLTSRSTEYRSCSRRTPSGVALSTRWLGLPLFLAAGRVEECSLCFMKETEWRGPLVLQRRAAPKLKRAKDASAARGSK